MQLINYGLGFEPRVPITIPAIAPPMPPKMATFAAVLRPPPAGAAAPAPAPAPAADAAPWFTVGTPPVKQTSLAPPFFLSFVAAGPCGVSTLPSLFFFVRRIAQPEASFTFAPF